MSLREKIIKTLRGTNAPNIEKMLEYMSSHRYYICKSNSHNHWWGGAAEHMWATYLMAKAVRDKLLHNPNGRKKRDMRLSEANIRIYATDAKLAIVCLLHDLCDMKVTDYTDNHIDGSGAHGRKSYWIMRNLEVGTPAEKEVVKNHMHSNAPCTLKNPALIAEYNVLHSILTEVDHKASGTAWNSKRYREGRTQRSGDKCTYGYLKAVALDRSCQCGKYLMYMDKDYELREFKNYKSGDIVWGYNIDINDLLAKRLILDPKPDIISSLYKYCRNNDDRICLVVGCRGDIPTDERTRLRQDSPWEQNVLICSNILVSLYDGKKDDSTEEYRSRHRMKFTMRDEIKRKYTKDNLKGGIFFPNVTMIRSGETDGFPLVAPWTIDILMIPNVELEPFAILSSQLPHRK